MITETDKYLKKMITMGNSKGDLMGKISDKYDIIAGRVAERDGMYTLLEQYIKGSIGHNNYCHEDLVEIANFLDKWF